MQDFSVTFRYAIQRECTLEWRVKRDRIDYNNLVFILKGKALYKIDDNEQVLTENQVLLIPAGSLREAERFAEEPLTLQSFDFFADQPLPALPQPVLTLDSLDFYLPLFQDFNRHWLTEKPVIPAALQSGVLSDSGRAVPDSLGAAGESACPADEKLHRIASDADHHDGGSGMGHRLERRVLRGVVQTGNRRHGATLLADASNPQSGPAAAGTGYLGQRSGMAVRL